MATPLASVALASAGPIAPQDAPVSASAAPPFASQAVPPAESQPEEGNADRRQAAAPIDGADRRTAGIERRATVDRRLVDMGPPTGLERRRGPGRRRSEDRRSAEEGEMTDEQFEFVLAVDTYKRLNNRPFPAWTEVLEVVKQLGYRKVAPSEITLSGAVSRASTHIPNPPKAPAAKPAESDYFPG